MGGQTRVVLKVLKVVTHKVCNDMILLLQLFLQLVIATLQCLEFLLEGLNASKLLGLHDHHIV